MHYLSEILYGDNFALWISIFVSFAIFALVMRRRRPNLPPGPTGLPLVGYLPFLGKEPHLKLHELGKKYGGIFGLYMARTYVVVVNDGAILKELFSKLTASDRPPDLFHSLPDGAGLGNLNGPDWVEQRRYTLQKMRNLGFGKSDWEKLVQDEMRALLDMLHQIGGKPFDTYKSLSASISNNVLSLVSGERLPLGDPRRDVVDRGILSTQLIFEQSGLVSLYPKLYGLATKLGLTKNKKHVKNMEDMNGYVRKFVHDSKHSDDTETYVQEYLKEIENKEKLNLKNSFTEENLIGNTQVLIIAGSDTTKVSLTWLFLAMASYPDIQDKVQQEIDSVLEKDEYPSGWVDRTKLPYCHATILEGQRWRTIAPLGVLHRTSTDVTIRDYVIPKNSNIISFLWALHNDDRCWKHPEVFQPERFLSEEGKVMTRMENFAPFSLGKRMCIGETVALIQLFTYFVGIMKQFRILPSSENDPPNLVGTVGITFQPARQKLRFIPR